MKPSVALIVNTYNQPDYLSRVLQAIAKQRDIPEEVLLADDGSDEKTQEIFTQWAVAQPFATRHIWHEKQGFRRSRILNAAIAETRSEYLVFLDGDTIPHPQFVGDHRSLARRGFYIQGHRVLVTEKGSRAFGRGSFSTDRRRAFLAGNLLGLKHIFRWPMPFQKKQPDLDGVRGCNLSAWRADVACVNGYNEDYLGWGCEDLDLAMRLMNSGVQRLDVRGHALCYHLWHPLLDRSNLGSNESLLDNTIENKRVTCERGLNLHLKKPLTSTRTQRAAAEQQSTPRSEPAQLTGRAMEMSR